MDLHTIFDCLAIINLLMGLYAIIIKKTQSTFAGINFWIASSFLIAFGYLFIALREVLPLYVTILQAQLFFITAIFLRIFGFNKFFNKKNHLFLKLIAIIYPIIYLVVLSYFTYISESMYIRTVIVGLTLSILSIYSGILTFRNMPAKGKQPYYFISITSFLFSFLFIFRVLVWVFVPNTRGLFNSNFINDLYFISNIAIDISWTAMFFVIHNQKLTKRIKDSEEKFRAFFEHNSSAMAIVDYNTTITMVNGEFCRMSGKSREELVGTSWTTQITQEDLPRLMDYNRRRIKKPDDAPDKYEFTLYHKSGGIVHAMASVALIPNKDEIIVSFIDISQRKKAEDQLKVASEELALLNRNKDMFFSIIAHDLRNPFHAILNLSQLSLNYLNQQEYGKVDKYLNTIHDVSHHTYYLLEDLLQWAGSQDKKFQINPVHFNLTQICNEAIILIKPDADKKDIRISIPSEPVQMWADLNMIKTVLRNLLTNAVKYSHVGGLIEISITVTNQNTTVSIKDTGVGIRANDIPKLWTIAEKHTTPGTNNERGSGLGLILSKKFIEEHHGSIWVESQPGQGSTFNFMLPSKQS